MLRRDDLSTLEDYLVAGTGEGPAPGTHVLLIHQGIEMHWTPMVFLNARTGAHVFLHAVRHSLTSESTEHSVLRVNGIGRVVPTDRIWPSKKCAFEGKAARCPAEPLLFLRDTVGLKTLRQEQQYELKMRGQLQ